MCESFLTGGQIQTISSLMDKYLPHPIGYYALGWACSIYHCNEEYASHINFKQMFYPSSEDSLNSTGLTMG